MKSCRVERIRALGSPAPQGAGGLKWLPQNVGTHSARPAPQGAGGLKFVLVFLYECLTSPAPQGAGGLKSDSGLSFV